MMLILLLACFLPIILWSWLVRKNAWLPLRLILVFLFAGFCAVLATSFCQFFFPKFLTGIVGSMVYSFLETALIEEALKFACLILAGRLLGSDSRPFTYPVPRGEARPLLAAAILVGLSFAAFENVAYSLANPSILLIRTFSTLPLHAALTLIAALWLTDRSVRWLYPAFAVVLHGSFNALLDSSAYMLAAYAVDAFAVGFAFSCWRVTRESSLDGE